MLPRLPLLQRYLLGEVCKVFAFVLFCVTVLLVFVGLFQQAAEAGLHPLKALRILPYAVTMMLPFTIPAALLLTVSMVYGRLTGDQELTAAKAAGIPVVAVDFGYTDRHVREFEPSKVISHFDELTVDLVERLMESALVTVG